MPDDDQQPAEDQQVEAQGNGYGNGQVDAVQVDRVVQQFTEAIRELAYGRRPGPTADDEEARARRQRVDFGYRALGTLMGRVSRTDHEFDVATFTACWDEERPVIHLYGLPDAVTHVELRAPATAEYPVPVEETVKVIRGGRAEPDAAGYRPRAARLEPKRTAHGSAVDSMIGLGGPTGPLLALGPRLEAIVPAHVE